MAKGDRYPGGCYQSAVPETGDFEGSGSSGRVDMEIAASEDSSAPVRKCISLNSDKPNAFGVPTQVISLSNMTYSERKDLIHRLKMDLQHIRVLQKRVESCRANGVTVSSSNGVSNYGSGRNGLPAGNYRKSSMSVGRGKKSNHSGQKVNKWNRGNSGTFDMAKQASSLNNTTTMLMKRCEKLLKQMSNHQHGWVFKEPVDVVKLNIPDYYDIIKHPMDLGTIKGKIVSGAYQSPMEFAADVRLTFNNAKTYNPVGSDVYAMADTLGKFFEVRWKPIEKKLPTTTAEPLLEGSRPRDEIGSAMPLSPSKKRKACSINGEDIPEPMKPVMTDEEKHKLSQELESLIGELPIHIIDFLREHSSDGGDSAEDEIEIDIDRLSDETLFKLRKLLDEYIQKKEGNNEKAEQCEIELLNESEPSNSSMQHHKGNDQADEEVDVGASEPPVSSCPSVEIGKDIGNRSSRSISSSSSSDSETKNSDCITEGAKASSVIDTAKDPATLSSGNEESKRTGNDDSLDRDQCDNGLDQHEETLQHKQLSVETDFCQDGDSAPSDKQVSPEKRYRAALLKSRFADTILKAREKTMAQGNKADPEKVRREREQLELQRKKEKARLQADAKAAEDARRRAEEEAAAEAKRKRELEREAARQALLKMEKTVEINENSRFLEDLEMLRNGPAEQLPSSVDETSPDHSQDGLGGFKLGGGNPLEQLGLYMKEDEEEEEGEPPCVPDAATNGNPLEQLGLYMKDDEEEEEGEPPCVPDAATNDVEEGEID